MAEKILILGGTAEAAELAGELVAQGHAVTTSLAGRTREPQPVAGELRSGGFSNEARNGAEGLAEYLKCESFNRLIDATHPFATQISANAERAAKLAGIPLEIRIRPPWQKLPGDNWTEVASLEQARDALPSGARVLLALGSQHIAVFAPRDDVCFIVRMVDMPDEPLALTDYQLIVGKPGQTMADEAALIRRYRISHIVCRNSGGKRAYAKIEAARRLSLPVIMVGRPE